MNLDTYVLVRLVANRELCSEYQVYCFVSLMLVSSPFWLLLIGFSYKIRLVVTYYSKSLINYLRAWDIQ